MALKPMAKPDELGPAGRAFLTAICCVPEETMAQVLYFFRDVVDSADTAPHAWPQGRDEWSAEIDRHYRLREIGVDSLYIYRLQQWANGKGPFPCID